MKKALIFITVFCMIITMLADTVAAAGYSTMKPPLSMQIFGKTVTPAPILHKDKVFIPLRAVGRALDYQVNYSGKSKTMDLISKTHKVTVTVGYINAKVNGASFKMDIAPVLSGENVYVPLTFVQKNFKYSVEYSKDKNMVIINKPGTGSPTTETAPVIQKPTTASNTIYVMDKKLNTTDKAFVKSSIVYIPTRLVGESLGYKVTWSASTNTMTLVKQNQKIVIVSGKTNATINSKAVKLDGAPYLSGGKLYAPLSMVSKNMGLETVYDSKKNNVSISQKQVNTPKPPAAQVPVNTSKPPVTQVPVNAPGVANIVNIAYDDGGGFPQINISADSAMGTYNAFTMSNPNRLVIDINSAAARTEFSSKEIQQEGISSVRIGQINNDPAIVRIVIDLTTQKSYKVVQSDDKKTISVLYANIINPISYQKEGDMDVIVVNGASNLDVSSMELENPDRVVIDLKGAVFYDLLQNIPVTSNTLRSVRIGQFDIGTARVVMDVAPEAYYQVKTTGNTSKIYISSFPFEFAQYNRYYNTAVLNLSPGKEVQYNVSIDSLSNIVNVEIPVDLKMESKRVDINDNLVRHVDYKTEIKDGKSVTVAAISMQDFVENEVISDPKTKLIKVRFKRKITSLQQLRVVIDAGHGGKDPGAIASDGTREKDLNLDVAKKLEQHLKAMGFNTIMTRSDDTFVELKGRTDIANTNYADFFMSIHFNAFSKTSNGIETLYYPNEVNEDYTISNKKIADIFHNEVLKATKRGSRGINPRPNLVVLNKTKMPSILAELGFMTNPEELALMKTDKYREDAARALAVSILKYFRDIQGVNIDIDPNSIYSWPYASEIAQPLSQPETQEVLQNQQTSGEELIPHIETPIVEEAAVQP
jgi:N-acetylmuramoyl-L-alanine amidase